MCFDCEPCLDCLQRSWSEFCLLNCLAPCRDNTCDCLADSTRPCRDVEACRPCACACACSCSNGAEVGACVADSSVRACSHFAEGGRCCLAFLEGLARIPCLLFNLALLVLLVVLAWWLITTQSISVPISWRDAREALVARVRG